MIIQNEEAIRIVREGAKLTLSEGFPQVLLPNVVPVMDMTPRFHRLTNIAVANSSSSTAAITIHTASSDKETFLNGAVLSIVKDSTCDFASGRINLICVSGGVSRNVVSTAALTLTAQDKDIYVSFERPIKVDKGSLITIGGTTYTVGTLVRCGTVYLTEVS